MKYFGGNVNEIKKLWYDAAPHLQARYCHSSLGTKIKIKRVGKFVHYDTRLYANHNKLNKTKPFTAKVIGKADLMVYMCTDGRKDSMVWNKIAGIASSRSVCKSDKTRRHSINEFDGSGTGDHTPARFGKVN